VSAATQVRVMELSADDIEWNLRPVTIEPSDDLLVDALVEAESYRLLAQQAIHRLREMQLQLDRQKETIARALADNRELRARLLGAAA
jgi:hypothetical protein